MYYTPVQVGFEMVDKIADAEGISLSTGSFESLLGEGDFCNLFELQLTFLISCVVDMLLAIQYTFCTNQHVCQMENTLHTQT